jgi:hypothetical protein
MVIGVFERLLIMGLANSMRNGGGWRPRPAQVHAAHAADGGQSNRVLVVFGNHKQPSLKVPMILVQRNGPKVVFLCRLDPSMSCA